MNVALTGMRAAETSISVTGDNLANANTIGFKSSRADFATQFSQTLSLGTPPDNANGGPAATGTGGGTNPIQIGLGTHVASITRNFTQGSLKNGSSETEMAIQGDGFFVVQKDRSLNLQNYTRNGIFSLNNQHELVTMTGEYVMGYVTDEDFQLQTQELAPITIPKGKAIAEATTEASLEGLIKADGEKSTQGTVLETPVLSNNEYTAPGTKLTSNQTTRPSIETAGTTATGMYIDPAVNPPPPGQSAMAPGQYVYRFAYSRADGTYGAETDFSTPLSGRVLAADPPAVPQDQNAVQIDNIPLGEVPPAANPPFTHVKVYRAIDPGNPTIEPTYTEVEELTLAQAALPYVDRHSEADIAGNPTLETTRLTGSYQYYVTYTDGSGNESRPSPISSSLNVNHGRITLSDLPSLGGGDPNPNGWTTRKIYRNLENDPTAFHELTEISNIDQDVTFIDSTDDDTLEHAPELSKEGQGNVLATDSTPLVNLLRRTSSGTFEQIFETGTLEFNATKGGNAIKQQELTVDNTTTLQELLLFMKDSMGIRDASQAAGLVTDQGVLGKTINGGNPGGSVLDGAVYLLGNTGEDNELKIASSGLIHIDDQGNRSTVDLPWNAAQDPIGTSITTDLPVYDTLGSPVNVRITMALVRSENGNTTYRWYADSNDNMPGPNANDPYSIRSGTGLITFDSEGKNITNSPGMITVERYVPGSVDPLSFELDMTAINALATNNPVLSMDDQDGAAAGTLYDFSIGEDGSITGIFTSGATRTVGQLRLAWFKNNEGLAHEGDNMFSQTSSSGPPAFGNPGSGPLGSVRGSTLEMSNTDIGTELVELITASTMYKANTRVVTTSQEMFDELMRMM